MTIDISPRRAAAVPLPRCPAPPPTTTSGSSARTASCGASGTPRTTWACAEGDAFAEKFLLDEREYAAHGGAFPVIVRDVGVVGTVTVSGLPQEEDHRLVVAVLRAFLG